MRKFAVLLCFLWMGLTAPVFAQENQSGETYGRTLNLGVGVGGYSGYYGYIGRSLPVLTLNYEIYVAKDFTLAPFISFYSYKNCYYWSGNNGNQPSKNYCYRETVIPIGVKGTYYFDDILDVNAKWDIYLGASLGFGIVNSRWDDDYDGDRDYYRNARPLLLDIHAGAEYHINDNIGVFLDLSNGVSTIGLAFH